MNHRLKLHRGSPFTVWVNGKPVQAYPGETLGTVLWASGRHHVRDSFVARQPRGLFCGIGACHECLVTLNGTPNVKACMTEAKPGDHIALQSGIPTRFDPVEGVVSATLATRNGGEQRMGSSHATVAVVGAGPAGLTAAQTASSYGLSVCLIDEQPRPGGQIYRQAPDHFQPAHTQDPKGTAHAGRSRSTSHATVSLPPRLAAVIRQSGVDYHPDTVVVNFIGDHSLLAVHGGGEARIVTYEALILATGAYDRVVPFPGWTLPGVFTAGGMQALIKGQGLLAADRVVVAGTGPLLLVVANQLLQAGAQVAAVVEAAAPWTSWNEAWRLPFGGHLLGDALRYYRTLRRHGVKVYYSSAVIEARGDTELHEVVIAPLDRQGRPKPVGHTTVACTGLAVGYGFVPSAELAGLRGCRLTYHPELGGWIPHRDPRTLETSVQRVYGAGDGAGVAGAVTAELEGALAGHSAARALGLIDEDTWERNTRNIRRQLNRLRIFRGLLDRAYAVRPGLYDMAQPDTVVCRCEDVTWATVREALGQNPHDLNFVKAITRAGMGMCQGRMCGHSLMEEQRRQLTARRTGRHDGGADLELAAPNGMFKPRPPAKPLPIRALILGGHGPSEGASRERRDEPSTR